MVGQRENPVEGDIGMPEFDFGEVARVDTGCCRGLGLGLSGGSPQGPDSEAEGEAARVDFGHAATI